MDPPISQFKLGRLCQIIQIGCDRATACKDVGISLDELNALLERDPEVRREVLAAESNAEVQHMGAVLKASRDEKNWRSSVWWIERRDAQHETCADADQEVAPAVVTATIARLAELIVAEFRNLDHRRDILARLLQITADPQLILPSGPLLLAGMAATEHGRPEVARAQGGSLCAATGEGGALTEDSQ
jgi:hypothetical protein